MKTIAVNGVMLTIARERGHGDGGMALRFFVDEGDGTFSGLHEWWSDPLVARAVYLRENADYLTWVVAEARRQAMTNGPDKPAAEPRPDPLTGRLAVV